jgi:predicted DNA-binding transcriptional regulator AlpA
MKNTPDEKREISGTGSRRKAHGFDNRLGLRLHEFSKLTGMSKATLWRRIKSNKVRIVRIGDMPFVAHAELVRLGLIDPD